MTGRPLLTGKAGGRPLLTGKAGGRPLLIGEVSRRCGVSVRMLRHYDSLGLVGVTGRTAGGYREYSDADIRRIFHIESLRSLRLSLREVGEALRDPEFAPGRLVDDLIRRTEERIARDKELLSRLRTVDASSQQGWDGVLRMVELMREFSTPERRQQSVLENSFPSELLAEALLAESDPNIAGALRWSLDRVGGGVDVVIAGMASDDVEVRRRAVLAVSGIDGPKATAALTTALTDTDQTVAARAALTLGRRAENSALTSLIDMVVEGRHDVEASEALAIMAQDNAIGETVILAFQRELPTASSATRIRVAQALVELPGPAARRALKSMADDDDRSVALIVSAFLARK